MGRTEKLLSCFESKQCRSINSLSESRKLQIFENICVAILNM